MRDPFIKVPFASSGDRSSIPDATQPSGSISMQNGWGIDYEKEVGVVPGAKSVNRQDMNQIFNLISTLVNRWQTEAFPEWVDSAANGGSALEYPVGTIVRYPSGSNFVLRESLLNNNTATPNPTSSTAQWADPTSGFGIGQTFNNNATAKYLLGVTYTNTTNKPMWVRVRSAITAGQIGSGRIIVDGVDADYNTYDSNSPIALNTIVPSGSSWSYALTNTSAYQVSVLE